MSAFRFSNKWATHSPTATASRCSIVACARVPFWSGAVRRRGSRFPRADAAAFAELLATLRDAEQNPEWAFVERELEIWMTKT